MIFSGNDTLKSSELYVLEYMNYIVDQILLGVQYVEDNLSSVLNGLLFYLLFCGSLYYLFCKIKIKHSSRNIKAKQRILFVISHPDDECMFFGPAILNLTKCSDKNIFLLCLSYGDFYQKGKLRKNELWKSCSILGIPESNIFLQKISALPDNPQIAWNENVIYQLILNYIEMFHFDAVITFDKDGVSGHLNHQSVYYGLAQPIANRSFPDYCSVYCLDSVNKLRKYSFIFDFLLSICFSSNWFIVSPSDNNLLRSALMAHETQYVWFRKIYIWISRYAYINTYSLLCENEAMFDMRFRDVCIYKKQMRISRALFK